MIWWIALAVVVLSLVALVLVALPVLRRMAALNRALRRARQRGVDAQALQGPVTALQARLAEFGERAEGLQHRLAAIKKSTPTP